MPKLEGMVKITDSVSVSENAIKDVIKNLKSQGYIKEQNNMYKSLVKTISVNVNNMKLTDKEFRQFIRNSLKVIDTE